MKTRLLYTTLIITAGILITAAPGYSSASLNFTGTGSTGTVTVTGNSNTETLSSLSGAPFTQVIISGATTAADNGTWLLNSTSLTASGSTITLNGTFGSCVALSGCSGTGLTGITGALETITLAGYPYSYNSSSPAGSFSTNNPTQTSVNINFGAATSITEIPILLTDLGLIGPQAIGLTGGYVNAAGSGTPVGNVFTFGSNFSDGLQLSITATPEPVSFFLLGTGLLGMGLVARRRSA